MFSSVDVRALISLCARHCNTGIVQTNMAVMIALTGTYPLVSTAKYMHVQHVHV